MLAIPVNGLVRANTEASAERLPRLLSAWLCD